MSTEKPASQKKVTLRSIPFEEAVADILKVKPPPEKEKRRGKGRKPKQAS